VKQTDNAESMTDFLIGTMASKATRFGMFLSKNLLTCHALGITAVVSVVKNLIHLEGSKSKISCL
jgi:hypothetical protein